MPGRILGEAWEYLLVSHDGPSQPKNLPLRLPRPTYLSSWPSPVFLQFDPCACWDWPRSLRDIAVQSLGGSGFGGSPFQFWGTGFEGVFSGDGNKSIRLLWAHGVRALAVPCARVLPRKVPEAHLLLGGWGDLLSG